VVGGDREAALSAQNIVVRYGGVTAVNGVSFDLRAGEVVGLIGPNGAGKSSALGALGGQLKIASGVITMGGRSIERLAPYQRARLGLVRTFQSTSEFEGMTVFENLVTAGQGAKGAALTQVMFQRKANRDSGRRAVERAWSILDRFEMAETANAYGRELSGGQRRLVEIMRCLMRDPKVLLLDEPMVGVAPRLVAKLVNDLKSVRDDGIALLIVEHALEVVSELCDRVVVMAQGEVICSGTYADAVANKEVRDAYLG
jgi:branched-chain amino acid transport system ATP-binding protein